MSTNWNSEDSFWKRTVAYSLIAVGVVAAGGAYYYFKVAKKGDEVPPPPVVNVPEEEAPATDAGPQHHPIPPVVPDKPLPKLSESDPDLTNALAGLFGKKSIDELLVPDMVVRHIVVTVDNLPRNKVAVEMRPVKPVGGSTAVNMSGDTITLSEENGSRYAPFISLVQTMDAKQLGALYIRYYPLFQEAYEDLGYPGQYFNDRLVQVIDHLLQTPDVRGPIPVKQGKVFYEYVDPTLEARSAGQKLLLRMGAQNEAVIKQKLRELRVVVTSSQDPEAGSPSAAGAAAAPPSEEGPTVQPDSAPEAAPAR